MSGERKDGGPAFPQIISVEDDPEFINSTGLTIRDYFAGQALADLACNVEYELTEHVPGVHHPTKDIPPNSADQIAELCYRLADAMLKERTRTTGER